MTQLKTKELAEIDALLERGVDRHSEPMELWGAAADLYNYLTAERAKVAAQREALRLISMHRISDDHQIDRNTLESAIWIANSTLAALDTKEE